MASVPQLILFLSLFTISSTAPRHIASTLNGRHSSLLAILESIDVLAQSLDLDGEARTNHHRSQQRNQIYIAFDEQLNQLFVDISLIKDFLYSMFQLEDMQISQHNLRTMEDAERKIVETANALETTMEYYRLVKTPEGTIKIIKKTIAVLEDLVDVIQFLKEQIKDAVIRNRTLRLLTILKLLGSKGPLAKSIFPH